MGDARGLRALRRMAVALLCLIALDPFVAPLVRRLEAHRYDGSGAFRFARSDFFTLGPLVEYLRENPKGPRPRVVFFGDSVVWGHLLDEGHTVPAEFERLEPHQRVLNLAINGLQGATAYLTSKAIIDAVDTFIVFRTDDTAVLTLSRMIPVSPDDVRRFHLEPPDAVEASLERLAGVWHLYRYSYRLQAGLFGTSTRYFVYTHKGQIFDVLLQRRPVWGANAPTAAAREEGVDFETPIAAVAPPAARVQELAARYPLAFDYARLVTEHGKFAIMVDLAGHVRLVHPIAEADYGDLNAHFRPHVVFGRMRIARDLLGGDGIHLTPDGARGVAAVLARRSGPIPSTGRE